MAVEYRCTCRKCGAFWCVNESDLKWNKAVKTAAGLNFANSLLQVMDHRSVSAMTAGETAARQNRSSRDYSRCPKCGSINIEVKKHQF